MEIGGTYLRKSKVPTYGNQTERGFEEEVVWNKAVEIRRQGNYKESGDEVS